MARSTNRSSTPASSPSSTSSRAQRALRRSSRGSPSTGSNPPDKTAEPGNHSSDAKQNQKQKQEKQKQPPAAAAASNRGRKKAPTSSNVNARATAKANSSAKANASANAKPPPQRQAQQLDFMGIFRNMLEQGAPAHRGSGPAAANIRIDLLKAKNVLEAAAGNLSLAANLYWDDYFATQANANASAIQNQGGFESPNRRKLHHRAGDAKEDNYEDEEEDDRKPSAAASGSYYEIYYQDGDDSNASASANSNRKNPPQKRRLRRSLDQDFQAADDDEDTKLRKRAAKRARKSVSWYRLADEANPNGEPEDGDSFHNPFRDEEEESKPNLRGPPRRNSKRGRRKDNTNKNNDGDGDDDGSEHEHERSSGSNEDPDDGGDHHHHHERAARHGHRARRREGERERNGDHEREREPQRILAQDAAETSISVSDDELLGRAVQSYLGRRRGGAASHHHHHHHRNHHHNRRGETRDPPGKPEAAGSSAAANAETSGSSTRRASAAVSRSEVVKAADAIHRKINPNTTHLSKPSAWFLSPEQNRSGRRRRGARGKSNSNRDDHDDDDDHSFVDSDPEDYINDDEWLYEKCDMLVKPALWGIPPVASSGDGGDSSSSQPQAGETNNDNNNNNNNDNNGGNNQNAGNNNNEENQEGNGNVVVADDEAVNVSGGEEDRASKSTEKPGMGIPHTWLSAGFQLSECGTGLCIPSPKAEDIPFFAWRRQQVNDQRNAVPPPYHCKSLTAVTSLVTALLYSGATIQGDQISCASGRPPWVSLTLEERKREFESRLADALSVLIFVAAKASRKRKQKAYRKALRRSNEAAKKHRTYAELLREAIDKRKAALAAAGAGKENNNSNNNNNSAKSETGKNDNDPDAKEAATEDERSAKRAPLPRERMDLIPATVWFNFPVAAAARAGDGPLYKKELRVISSWSNIRDIKLYVQSNTRAFTEKAGIALFLEAIVSIHGNGVIARQLSRCADDSRASAAAAAAAVSAMPASPSVNKENEDNATFATGSNPREGDQANASDSAFAAAERCSLIRCTCEDRQKKLHEEKPLPLNVRIDPNNLLDTTPDGTECASTELLTLLLTGKVRSDWTLCNAGELGIGLLMDTDEEVARTMARPKRPVWLLRGETCYSVLTVEGYWRCGTATNAWSSGEDITTISRVDKPGVPLSLVHWNGWYGQRGKTEMRLIASAPEPNEEIPAKKRLRKYCLESSSTRPLSAEPVSTVSLLLMKKRRHESLVNAICGREHACNQEKQRRNPIRAHELERIHMSEEDQKLYPNNHKMWRFDMGVKSKAKAKNSKKDDDDDDYRWVPYYRLLPREKLLVETKLGPKIKTILWTRWPGAVIDHFAPKKGGHPVV